MEYLVAVSVLARRYTCGLRTDGTIQCWRANDHGWVTLGIKPETTPHLASPPSPRQQVAEQERAGW